MTTEQDRTEHLILSYFLQKQIQSITSSIVDIKMEKNERETRSEFRAFSIITASSSFSKMSCPSQIWQGGNNREYLEIYW